MTSLQHTDCKIIFLHIPKTGGLTLYNVLGNQYKKDEIYTIPYKDRRPWHEAFIDLPAAQKEKIKVLRGHMPFGFHQYFAQPAKYITMLREPVKRVISHYYYIQPRKNHYLYDKVIAAGMTLEQYVLSNITHELDNGQTRSLSGIAPEQVCDEAAYQLAVKHLDEHFLLAGALDYFDETLILLKEMLGWGYPVYHNENISKTQKQELSAEIKAEIARRNQYDVRLYALVKERMEALIAPQRAHLDAEIAKLHRLSYPYRQYGALKHFVKRVIGKK